MARPMPAEPVSRISQSFSPNGLTCGVPTCCGPKLCSISEISQKAGLQVFRQSKQLRFDPPIENLSRPLRHGAIIAFML